MKEFWDSRYADEEWAYGKEPNVYFKEQLKKIRAGRLLLPADGEGRNSVHAAREGWEVTAFDLSISGRDKALSLAAEHNVEIDYLVGNLADMDFPEGSFDAMALVFAHFPPHLKLDFHHKLTGYLKPGGTVILEAFSVEHLKYSTANPAAGGPKNPDMLFKKSEINQLFPEFEILELTEEDANLEEGLYHRGLSSVVRFVGRKKS